MPRLTLDEITREPWTYTAAQYQAAANVKQPWIAEISPMQYSHLSKRQQAQYDAKNAAEWQASADCKAAWRVLVVAAFDAGQFTTSDPATTNEAKSVVFHALQQRERAAREERKATAEAENRFSSSRDFTPGDRVYSPMCGAYLIVQKVNRLTVRATFETPPAWMNSGDTMTINMGALQRLSPADLAASIA